MKVILTIFWICFCNINLMAHGGHLATFIYKIELGAVFLDFKIESETLDHFELDETCENYKAASAMCLVQYINQHTSFKFQDSIFDFQLQSSKRDARTFSIQLIAKGDFSDIGDIKIKNSCFFEYDQNFENRIIVQKGDQVKSYRLDHKHTDIKISTKAL